MTTTANEVSTQRRYKFMSTEIGTYRCAVHGKVDRKIFVVPLPWQGGVAHYRCFHCWHESGEPEVVTGERL